MRPKNRMRGTSGGPVSRRTVPRSAGSSPRPRGARRRRGPPGGPSDGPVPAGRTPCGQPSRRSIESVPKAPQLQGRRGAPLKGLRVMDRQDEGRQPPESAQKPPVHDRQGKPPEVDDVGPPRLQAPDEADHVPDVLEALQGQPERLGPARPRAMSPPVKVGPTLVAARKARAHGGSRSGGADEDDPHPRRARASQRAWS